MLVADGILRKTFRQHPYWEDLRSYSVMHTLLVLDTFDPEQPNAFAWATTTIYRACLRHLQDEDAARFRALAYGRYLSDHHGARAGEFLAEHQEHIEYHEKRLADLRTKRAEQAQATTKTPRKPGLTPEERNARRRQQYAAQQAEQAPRAPLTLPDGTPTTLRGLARSLGIPYSRLRRRLDAGESVADIVAGTGGA